MIKLIPIFKSLFFIITLWVIIFANTNSDSSLGTGQTTVEMQKAEQAQAQMAEPTPTVAVLEKKLTLHNWQNSIHTHFFPKN